MLQTLGNFSGKHGGLFGLGNGKATFHFQATWGGLWNDSVVCFGRLSTSSMRGAGTLKKPQTPQPPPLEVWKPRELVHAPVAIGEVLDSKCRQSRGLTAIKRDVPFLRLLRNSNGSWLRRCGQSVGEFGATLFGQNCNEVVKVGSCSSWVESPLNLHYTKKYDVKSRIKVAPGSQPVSNPFWPKHA